MQSSPDDAVIQVAGIRHLYPGSDQPALEEVDLVIRRGLFGLLGPNGAGKTTLMRILCTLLEPTEGTVTLAGHNAVAEPDVVRRLFGYLPQEFGAWRQHRVEEVLDTLALLSGVRERAHRRQRIEEVLSALGLADVASRKVKKLSGGMVRRLGVAQALVHEPEILVVDEPTVGMDPEERLRFRKLLADLASDRTIVLSTHIVADLGSACGDLALLDAGRVVFRGPPARLLQQAAGRVFEVVVTSLDEEAALEGRLEIVSRCSEGQNLRLRGVAVAEHPPLEAAAVEAPTLEEAYLAKLASHRAAVGEGAR